MAIASTVQLDMKGILAAQTVFTHFYWYRDNEEPTTLGSEVCAAFYDDVWAVMQPLVSDAYRLEEVVGWYSDFTIGPQAAFTRVVNEQGGIVTTDPMPGFNTVNVMTIPDNTSKEPPGNPDFSLGWRGFSGFSEVIQDNGLIDATGIAAWDVLTQQIRSLDVLVGAGDLTFVLGMYRHSDIIAERTYAYVQSTYVNQKVGTRLSRKR